MLCGFCGGQGCDCKRLVAWVVAWQRCVLCCCQRGNCVRSTTVAARVCVCGANVPFVCSRRCRCMWVPKMRGAQGPKGGVMLLLLLLLLCIG